MQWACFDSIIPECPDKPVKPDGPANPKGDPVQPVQSASKGETRRVQLADLLTSIRKGEVEVTNMVCVDDLVPDDTPAIDAIMGDPDPGVHGAANPRESRYCSTSPAQLGAGSVAEVRNTVHTDGERVNAITEDGNATAPKTKSALSLCDGMGGIGYAMQLENSDLRLAQHREAHRSGA